jgi:predicted nucleic acid-binding protein
VIDTMLAATAIENDLFLVTRNTKDVRHSGSAIFNPWDDDPSLFIVA